MAFIVALLILILFGFKIVNKSKEINVEKIIEKGILKEEMMIKGDVFYKSTVRDSKDNLSYLTYIRLENGKEIAINQMDFYSILNTGNVINLNKETYIYKSQKLTFYSVLLDGLENIRLCEELDFVN